MKKRRIGILLLISAVALLILNLALVGCTGRRADRNDQTTTTTTDNGSPLVPNTDDTLTSPQESETLLPHESESGSQSESVTHTETSGETTSATTTKQESATTTKQETTATTTTKATTTEATTTKATTTTTTATTNAATTTTKTPETTTTTPATNEAGEWLRFEAFEDTHAGAAAYLGRSAQELAVTDILDLLDLPLTAQDITVIDNGNSEDRDNDEWYLILPRYRDTVVRLHDADIENGVAVSGELLAEGMHPMLVRCDPEDGDPSVFVEMIRGDEKITFALMLDTATGKPVFHERMLDITPAQTNPPTRNRARVR